MPLCFAVIGQFLTRFTKFREIRTIAVQSVCLRLNQKFQLNVAFFQHELPPLFLYNVYIHIDICINGSDGQAE